MNESAMKECPYCHQMFMCSPGEIPQEVCKCAGANRWRACSERQKRLDEAIVEQFGSECGEFHQSWQPLKDEEVDCLRVMAEWVAFERFAKIQVLCEDGSTCVITAKKVMRSQKISAETAVS